MTLYGLYNVGAILQEESLANVIFQPPVALLFGTICSAVDPVAVSIYMLMVPYKQAIVGLYIHACLHSTCMCMAR